MSYRDFEAKMDAIAKDESKWFNSKTLLDTTAKYNLYAFGSASCATGSYTHALDAYAEYQQNCAY